MAKYENRYNEQLTRELAELQTERRIAKDYIRKSKKVAPYKFYPEVLEIIYGMIPDDGKDENGLPIA